MSPSRSARASWSRASTPCCAGVRPALAGETLCYADIEMDLAAHRVRRGGEPVPLGPDRIPLAPHFLEHPGRVFSRERLLDAVWGHAPISRRAPSTSTSAGCARRWTVGDRPTSIRTVRSAGYALDLDR